MGNVSTTDRRVWSEFTKKPDAIIEAYETSLDFGSSDYNSKIDAPQSEMVQPGGFGARDCRNPQRWLVRVE